MPRIWFHLSWWIGKFTRVWKRTKIIKTDGHIKVNMHISPNMISMATNAARLPSLDLNLFHGAKEVGTMISWTISPPSYATTMSLPVGLLPVFIIDFGTLSKCWHFRQTNTSLFGGGVSHCSFKIPWAASFSVFGSVARWQNLGKFQNTYMFFLSTQARVSRLVTFWSNISPVVHFITHVCHVLAAFTLFCHHFFVY